jgi:hypothetical protein
MGRVRWIACGLLLAAGWGAASVMPTPSGTSVPARATVAGAAGQAAELLQSIGPHDAWLPAGFAQANWEALFHSGGR